MIGKTLSGPGFTSPLPGASVAPLAGQVAPQKAASGATSPGGVNYEVVRITSAAAINATNPGEYLVGLILEGGATPGWIAYVYDTVNSGILPVGASGLDATGAIGPANEVFYPMNIFNPGTAVLTAGNMTFGGGLAAVRAILSSQPSKDPNAIPSFSRVRGVAVTGNESGTSGTSKTYTMPGGLSLSPRAAVAMLSIEAGTATGIPSGEIDFPAVQPFGAYSIPATLGERYKPPRAWPVPPIGPATSFSLTHKAISLGGATDVAIAGVLYV